MIEESVREQLVDSMMQIIDQERMIEGSKLALAGHADFNLFDAFRIFDVMGRGCLTLSELYNGLVKHLGLVPSQDELELFFQRYDRDMDGSLRFTEFCDAFIPLDPHIGQVLNGRQSMHRADVYMSGPPEQYFLPITIMDLKELFRTHFRVEVLAEDMRVQLERNPLFELPMAFQLIERRGKIGYQEVRNTLEMRGVMAADRDLTAILNKFEHDTQGNVAKTAFLAEMLPKLPHK